MLSNDVFDLEAMKMAVNYKGHILSKIMLSGAVTARTLDLGAGRGDFAVAIKKLCGTSPICVEVDPLSIASLECEGLSVHQSHETIPPLTSLYSINVLEHIEDPAGLLRSYASKLRRGSPVFIYVPANPSLFSEWDSRVGHFHRFTRSSIEAVIVSSGLRVLDSGYSDPVGGLVTWVMKLLSVGGKPLSPGSVRAFDRYAYPVSRLLEPIFARFFGKNVWVTAYKP